MVDKHDKNTSGPNVINNFALGAVVLVKWSASWPSTPTIRVRIPLTSRVFSVKVVFEKNENKLTRGRGWPFAFRLVIFGVEN